MEMSFQNYIDNPLGKRNAVFSQREVFKGIYTEKFNAVFLREAGKIDFHLFFNKTKDEYYILVKIPSETVPGFYYDVVIQFYTNNNALRAASDLKDYNVRFYSNDPAFVFTYLRVFLKNDMFVDFLKSRSPKEALKKDPKEKNPYEIPGYVKSIYFAYLFMKLKNLFNKSFYTSYGETSQVQKKIIDLVRDADSVIAERQELGKKVAADNRREKKTTNSANSRVNSLPSNDSTALVRKTKIAPKTGSVKTAKTVKRAKTSKKI